MSTVEDNTSRAVEGNHFETYSKLNKESSQRKKRKCVALTGEQKVKMDDIKFAQELDKTLNAYDLECYL